MKKILFLFAFLAVFVTNANAQYVTGNTGLVKYKSGNTNSDLSKRLLYYNTSGTAVTKFTGATAATVLDTVVSEFIPFDADLYSFSLSAGAGDTIFANVGYMLVAGVDPNSQPAQAGFYTRGGIAFVKADSIISLGLRQQIVGQTAGFSMTSPFVPTGHTSTQGGFGGSRDSTWTNTFGNSAVTVASSKYIGFRIVLIQYDPHATRRDVSNTSILNQSVLMIRRFN